MEYYDDFPCYSTVKELVLQGAVNGGTKREFLFEDKNGEVVEKTFADVHEDEMRLGAYLRADGLTPPEKIAILSGNSYLWNVVYYTAAAGGYVVVPLDMRLSAAEIVGQLKNCACDALFYSEENAEKAEAVKNDPASTVRRFYNMDDLDGVLAEGEAKRAQYEAAYLSQEVNPADLLTIVYTSGTTGKTKGVMLSHKNVMADVNASLHAVTGGHAIGFLPLNHTYSWVTGLFAGLARSEWGFICTNLRHIYKDIKNYQPVQFAAVPLAVEMIHSRILSNAKRKGSLEALESGIEVSRNFLLCGFDSRREFFSDIHENLGGNLEYILCGGAYLNPKIEQFMYDIGIPIITGYGLTECSPCVTCSRRDNFKIGSVGLPLECCELKIKDPDENGVGEICVRGDNVMMGYYNDPEATAAVFDGDWFLTGDYGYIDGDGFLFFTGRKKNLIILSNGKNVSPEEIESALSEIETVKEVLVYEEAGKITAEFWLDTEKFPDAGQTIRDEVARVNGTLAEFKRVQAVKTRDTEFPKTTTLKIIRNNRGV